MRTTLKIATIALALAGTSLAANAQDVTFDVGNVAIGYSDGYMGTDHQFHAWEHRADAEAFRAKRGGDYRAWRHDDSRHRNDH